MLLAASALFGGADATRAQVVDDAPGGGPAGGRICGLAVSSQRPGLLYASVDVLSSGGIFKSVNGGDRWMPAERGLGRTATCEIAIAPDDDRTLYALADGGLIRTRNGGEAWEALGELPEDRVYPNRLLDVAVPRGRPDTVYLLRTDGLLQSRDGGATWTRTLDRPRGVVLAPSNPDIVYAVMRTGIRRSENGGRSWRKADGGLPADSEPSARAVDPTAPRSLLVAFPAHGLFQSGDGGRTWTFLSRGPAGLMQAGIAFTQLLISASQPTIVYARTHGTLWRSADRGVTWQALAAPQGQTIATLAIDPLSASTLYAGTDNGVLRSRDAGLTWTLNNAGVNRSAITSLRVIGSAPTRVATDGYGPGPVFRLGASGGDGVWLAPGDTPHTAPATRARATSDVTDPREPDVMYTIRGGTPMKSVNRGKDWQPMPVKPAGTPMLPKWVQLDPSDPSTVFVDVHFDGLYRSRDRGERWTRVQAHPTARRWMTFDSHEPNMAFLHVDGHYLGGGGDVHKSTDRGQHWTQVSFGGAAHDSPNLVTPAHDLAVVPTRPATLFVFADTMAAVRDGTRNAHVLLRSVDGGATWRRYTDVPGTARLTSLVHDPADPKILFLGTAGNGLFVSRNGGESWQPTPSR